MSVFVLNIMGQGFHTAAVIVTVSNSVCLSEEATVTKGAGLTDRSISTSRVASWQKTQHVQVMEASQNTGSEITDSS